MVEHPRRDTDMNIWQKKGCRHTPLRWQIIYIYIYIYLFIYLYIRWCIYAYLYVYIHGLMYMHVYISLSYLSIYFCNYSFIYLHMIQADTMYSPKMSTHKRTKAIWFSHDKNQIARKEHDDNTHTHTHKSNLILTWYT